MRVNECEYDVSSGVELAELIRQYARDRGLGAFVVEAAPGRLVTADGLAKTPVEEVRELHVRRYFRAA